MAAAEGTGGQGAVESQDAGVAAKGGQQSRPAQGRDGEGTEEAGEWADNWLMAGLGQQDLVLESQAGSSSAEGQVCTGEDAEGAEPVGKAFPGLESVKARGV